MVAADGSVRCNILPFRETASQPTLDIPGIVAIGNKADFLTVRLVMAGKPGFFSNPAHLVLRKAGQRETEPAQLFLGQPAEHIRLIACPALSHRQQHPLPIFAQTGIMSGRDRREAVCIRRLHQTLELDQRIADDTGVRSSAFGIRTGKIPGDLPVEILLHMPDNQRYTQLIGGCLRISDRAIMDVAHPQDDPCDLISGVPQHRRTCRAVNAAGKCNQNLVVIHTLPLSYQRI